MYNNNFFDTQAGQNFIAMLENELPKLANKPVQFTQCVPSKEGLVLDIEKNIRDGFRYVNHIACDQGYLVIYEK